MKRLLRFLLLLALLTGVAAVAVRLWQRLAAPVSLGTPIPEAGPPPPVAEDTPAPADPGPAADDLAEVWGIGPVYRGRLAEVGITTFAALAGADTAAVVAATGVPPERAADWIAQAAARAGR